MKMKSAAFLQGGSIPSLYTCEGKNISPPLEFLDVPKEAKSLVLIMDDPDVPKSLRPDGMFDHWVVIDIPPHTKTVEEGKNPKGILGLNTKQEAAYKGPCPPDREHRYFFKLYALDTLLHLKEPFSKKEVESAMQGHILEKCELMGLYEKDIKDWKAT